MLRSPSQIGIGGSNLAFVGDEPPFDRPGDMRGRGHECGDRISRRGLIMGIHFADAFGRSLCIERARGNQQSNRQQVSDPVGYPTLRPTPCTGADFARGRYFSAP